jgi:hypothetical protein
MVQQLQHQPQNGTIAAEKNTNLLRHEKRKKEDDEERTKKE